MMQMDRTQRLKNWTGRKKSDQTSLAKTINISKTSWELVQNLIFEMGAAENWAVLLKTEQFFWFIERFFCFTI
jgi:hypothetical protein